MRKKGIQVFEGDAKHIVGITRLVNLALYVASARLVNVQIEEQEKFGQGAKRIKIRLHPEASQKGVTKAGVEKLQAIAKPFRIGVLVLHKIGFLNADKKIKPLKVKDMQVVEVEFDPEKPMELAIIFDQSAEIMGNAV